MEKKKPVIRVSFAETDYLEICEYAEADDRTPSNLLKTAVKQHMRRYPKKGTPNKTYSI